MSEVINIESKLGKFNETWTPKIIGELNGQQVKLAKLRGELMWHAHKNEDELFLVIDGELTIQMRDCEVHLKQGEMFIVPRGVEHNPVASEGASVLLFEPAQTKHTGEHITERTVTKQKWI
jgi:mannose-6-phosphate isomerase-like protein (cupin superfamily)